MLSKQDDETICRTGPGTPMGDAMRRFWMPVAHSTDLPEPGREPKVVELLGERFLCGAMAQAGRVSLSNTALHRGASLQLARSEPEGLRCIYKVISTPHPAATRAAA
jgi:phthalate 4,5-dioxygenase oxygenase subunit